MNSNAKIILRNCFMLLGIVTGIVVCLMYWDNKFSEIESSLDEIHEKLDEWPTREELGDLYADVNEMHDYLFSDGGVQDQLEDITSDIAEIKAELIQRSADK